MKKTLIIIGLILFLYSCRRQEKLILQEISNLSKMDTILISELITERIISKVSLTTLNFESEYKLDYPTTGVIRTKDGKHEYLITLTNNKKVKITINPDSTIITNNLGDSLLNYLWKSNNSFIGKNSGFIFTTSKFDSIVNLFEKFRLNRDSVIICYKNRLTPQDVDLLKFQNSARIYSFLFWFGRNSKQLDFKNSFYNFANQIDNNSIWLKSLPDVALYKYEVEYFKTHDSLTSIKSFLHFIELKTKGSDLSEFLKLSYLNGIIESPSYWLHHANLLTVKTLKQLMESEKNSKYYYLVNKVAGSYFLSAKGEIAYNFSAERPDGTTIKLSDYNGKIVFIDAWATWCAACVQQRPNAIALAQKYKDNSNIQILLISMDASKANWVKYISKNRKELGSLDYIIENGMKTDFGKYYNISSIPRYMLIDRNGIIINSNMSEPSLEVEDMIDKLLEKN